LWGVYANQSFPSYIILAGLVLVLGFAGVRTFQRGFGLCRAEREMATDAKTGEELKPSSDGGTDSDPEEKEDTNPDKKYNWACSLGNPLVLNFGLKK